MKNICVITGTRAEYGVLKNLLLKFKFCDQINLILFVTGSHLDNKYGNTYKIIEDDKFIINEKIYMNIEDDSPYDILQSMAIELKEMSKCFLKYKIDYLFITGDRYEMLIASQIGLIYNIPIIHLYGGDVSEGAYDNAIRNSISHMASIHFVTSPSSYDNLSNMGLSNINLIGDPGLYEITNFKNDENFLDKYKIPHRKYLILIVYHPETLNDKKTNIDNVNLLFDSLIEFKHFNDTNLIFINSNSDNFNFFINKKIEKLTDNYENIYSYKSLNRYDYFNFIYFSNLFIGNSSSGIYEVPLFNKLTLNIGIRQKGRDCGNSVIHLKYDKKEIIYNIDYYLNNRFNKKIEYPFLVSNSLDTIVEKIINS